MSAREAEQVSGGRDVRRFSALLAAVLLLLLLDPFVRNLELGFPLMRIVFTVVLFTGIYAVSRSRTVWLVAFALLVPALLTGWIREARALPGLVLADAAFLVLFLGYVSAVILSRIVADDRVSGDTIAGGVCVYFLVGLIWAVIYTALEYLEPGSFAAGGAALEKVAGSRSSAASELLYYSYVTLTTLGYGDVVPKTPQARVLAAVEAVVGQLYLAVFIARLVGLHLARGRS